MQSDVAHSDGLYLALAWLDKNKQKVSLGAGIVLLAGLVVWFMIWQKDQKQVAAGEALSGVLMSQVGVSGPHAGTVAGYLKVASDYPNSAAASRGLLMAAGTLFTEGKYNEAKAQFQRFVREYHDSPLLGQALLGLACCLNAQGQTNDAAGAYKDLVDHHPGETVIPQAKFGLATLYEAQNKPELARALYEDVVQSDRYGAMGDEAAMRLHEMQARTPSTAPRVPTPVIPPPMLEKK